MATAADKKRWDKLHVDLAKAQAAYETFDRELYAQYHGAGGRYERHWLPKGKRDKIERLDDRRDALQSEIIDMVVRISPRGERWLSGVPAWWVAQELTWEDAIRPANEQLSVVVPGSYGYSDGYVKEGAAEVDRKALKPGDWIEVRDPSGRISYGHGHVGAYRVVRVGRANVVASIDVRFSPTGPWHHQEHKIPLHHVVRVIPPNEMGPRVETKENRTMPRASRNNNVGPRSARGREMNMPRGTFKDANHLHEILEKGVLLNADRVEVEGVIDLDDDTPVNVGIIVDVQGYGPHVGSMYVKQGGHIDESLQAAEEILEEWTLEHYEDSDPDLLTETFDGWAFKISPQEFIQALEGTPADALITEDDVVGDEGEDDDAEDDDDEGDE